MKIRMNFGIQCRSRLKIASAISMISVACLEAADDTPHAILVKEGQPVKYDKIAPPPRGSTVPKTTWMGRGWRTNISPSFSPSNGDGELFCRHIRNNFIARLVSECL
jgi:hypothetical protein